MTVRGVKVLIRGRAIVSLILFLLSLVAALGVTAYLSRDFLVSLVLEQAIHKLTGLQYSVGSVSFDPLSGKLAMNDLRFYNPRGFSDAVMARLRKLYLDVDMKALVARKKVHLSELAIDLDEVHLEKNPEGAVNLREIRSAKREKEKEPKKGDFLIDRLELSIGRVEYDDRSGFVPKKLQFNLGIEKEVFTRVTDPRSVIQIIILRILYNVTLGNLGLDLGALQSEVGETLGGGKEIVLEGVRELRGVVEETGGTLRGILRTARGVTEKVRSELETTLKTAVGAEQNKPSEK